MDIKYFLESLYHIDMHVRYLQLEIDDFNSRGDIYSSFLSDLVLDFENCLETYIESYKLISFTINLLDDDIMRLVLNYKYVQYKSFEEIAEILFFSSRHVRRLHNKAIIELSNIINNKS